jgi:hypothetical protein
MARKKKDVSSIISAAGVMADIFSGLDKQVRAHNGTDEDWHRLTTPEGEKLLARMARVMVPKRIWDPNLGEWSLTVDYNKDREYLVEEAELKPLVSGVESEYFPDKASGKVLCEMVLVNPLKATMGEDLGPLMSMHSMRPATVKELLTFAAADSAEVLEKHQVVALGSPSKEGYVPAIGGTHGANALTKMAHLQDLYWMPYTRFLAVRVTD